MADSFLWCVTKPLYCPYYANGMSCSVGRCTCTLFAHNCISAVPLFVTTAYWPTSHKSCGHHLYSGWSPINLTPCTIFSDMCDVTEPFFPSAFIMRLWRSLVGILSVCILPCMGGRTPEDCAINLDCTIYDLEKLQLAGRQDFVARMQSIHGPALGASDRWMNILGEFLTLCDAYS
jgi:hypothetical protein